MAGWTREQVKQMLGSSSASIVIPVNREIRFEQRILNFAAVEQLLKKTKTIASGECGCRKKLKNCDHTLEGCLFLSDWGERAIKEGYAQPVSLAQALETLKRTFDEGLVLIAGTEDPPVKICSCCTCCCFVMAGLQQYRMENSLVGSGYAVRLDENLCDGCLECVPRCRFQALTAENGAVKLDSNRCFGCGLCTGKCPGGALTLAAKE